MIRLSKRELLEMATMYMVANTPHSLFSGLRGCTAVNRMRKADPAVLSTYYDHITARAERDEIVLGLAYGVLLGTLLNHGNTDWRIQPDASRLNWGQKLEGIARSSTTPTRVLLLSATPPARGTIINQASGSLILPPGQNA